MSKILKQCCYFFLLLPIKLWAVECYFTIAKTPCWKDYDVNVVLVDTVTGNIAQSIHVGKGESYNRVHFSCQPKQIFSAYAQFSPVVWENDKNLKFRSVRFWAMPLSEPATGAVWSIQICYPAEFSDVPMPKSDITNCVCDFSEVPQLENPIKTEE